MRIERQCVLGRRSFGLGRPALAIASYSAAVRGRGGAAYLLDPLANRLAKHGVSRLVAALLILGGFVLVFVGLFVVVVPVLAGQFSAFIEHLPGYVQRLQTLVSDPSRPWLTKFSAMLPAATGPSASC